MVKIFTEFHFKKLNLVTPEVFSLLLEAVQASMRGPKQNKNTLLFSYAPLWAFFEEIRRFLVQFVWSHCSRQQFNDCHDPISMFLYFLHSFEGRVNKNCSLKLFDNIRKTISIVGYKAEHFGHTE